jgi:hypothetical protein
LAMIQDGRMAPYPIQYGWIAIQPIRMSIQRHTVCEMSWVWVEF